MIRNPLVFVQLTCYGGIQNDVAVALYLSKRRKKKGSIPELKPIYTSFIWNTT